MTRAAPTEAKVRDAVKGAQAAGFVVSGVEVLPDRTVRVLIAGQARPQSDDPFDMVDMRR